MSNAPQKQDRLSIEVESVARVRTELRQIVQGTPIAEAAVEGFNDWQVIEAMERLWVVGKGSAHEGVPTSANAEDWLAVLLQG